MKKLLFVMFVLCFGFNSYASTGNLSVNLFSASIILGAGPGDTLVYTVFYGWEGDGPAADVKIKQSIPSEVTFLSSYPQAVQSGNEISWSYPSVENNGSGFMVVSVLIHENVSVGAVITSTATIEGNVTDNDPDDNTSISEFTVQNTTAPDLWLFHYGLLENIDQGIFLTTEKDVTANLEIQYFNFSNTAATNVLITDELPQGVQFVSSDPAPASVDGNKVYWNIAELGKFGYGKISLNVMPTVVGSITNNVSITCAEGDRADNNNTASFTFSVVAINQPILLKPKLSMQSDDAAIVGSSPVFEGMAKAGSKVTLYEGDSLGTFGDFSGLHPVELGSAIAGPDRRWTIATNNMATGKTNYLYLRAEIDGEFSAPLFNYWQPYKLRIEPFFALAGFDMDNFVVGYGEHEFHPGALGTSTSGTPDEDIRIVKRFKAPAEILTNQSMWDAHKMKLVITEDGETREEWLPVSEVLPAAANASGGKNSGMGVDEYVKYDFIYVHKGFGPGATIEVWCLPSYYDENNNLLVAGLVWVKCHEILIDPAGYVYDKDIAGSDYEWPEIPPQESLIHDATVTCLTRTGDDQWSMWDAAATGQINPQVTDEATEDKVKVSGYFAFYVPSGQYRVTATAPGYAEATSPILTVVEAPVFYNIPMQKVEQVTGVKDYTTRNKNKPDLYVLDQNYPNPFNPLTTISFYIPKATNVTLKIYDLQGKEAGTLINNEYRSAGRYSLKFDGSSLASGVYLYKLSAGDFASVKKLMLVK